MIADEAAHALELQQQGRHKAARWIVLCAWIHTIIMVFRAPFAALLTLVKRSVA